ncbi:MarR family winged helix-turn-helix transcriptional regulator [Streptomyces sp. MBT55]|uniref:MarR family winged helix-turn-helix transcriptional regulator n=1 Tax=Streptomyces sp. MBT55 TaxID=1488386 RepID=UPI0027DDEEBB|nr:MarR family transcriptional regulator [Streptomyces sp. MBT55]
MAINPFDVNWAEEQVEVMHRLRDVAVALTELNHHLASWMRLSSTDSNALGQIIWADQAGDPLSPADLGRKIGMTSGATTALLNRIEAAGHIRRTHEHADRRRVTLRPQPAARESTRAFLAEAGTEIAGAVLSAHPAELATVTAFLSRITAAATAANHRLGN